MNENNLNEYYLFLWEQIGISTQTLQAVTAINGWNLETFNDILFWATGYRTYEQYMEE